ncbi:AMP-binding protein [Fodinicola feengrottensis]|uniref:AMP-binding protein n=1 Tax=Fodinicola feengrottensis TaxID=435914 RepID=UPI0013D0241C|nr:AMP-binding protein [Fodinicola feengrottensis]
MSGDQLVALDLRSIGRRTTGPAGSAEITIPLPDPVVTAIGKLATETKTKSFAVILTALAATFSRYTGQARVPILVAPGGRWQLFDLEIDGDPVFRELLRRTAAGDLVPDPTDPAMCQVAAHHRGTVPPDHSPRVRFCVESAQIRITYDSATIDDGAIARFASHLLTLLTGAATEPDTPLSKLPLLSPAEFTMMLDRWNDTAQDLPQDRCLHEHFTARTELTPDAVAIIHSDGILTYADLDAASNRLASHLQTLGVGPDTIVAICLRKTPDLVISMLAILKAGGAFLSLDLEYPTARLEFILADSACRVVITTSDLTGKLPPGTGETVELDQLLAGPTNPGPPRSAVTVDNLCYLIYTSGSTGTPKAIAVTHRGVANNLLDLNTRFSRPRRRCH